MHVQRDIALETRQGFVRALLALTREGGGGGAHLLVIVVHCRLDFTAAEPLQPAVAVRVP